MYRSTFLAGLFAVSGAVAEGLKPVEYFGDWTSTYSPTRGESNTLRISEDLGAKFARNFGGTPETQEMMTPARMIRFVDDIMVIDFRNDQSEATYKLVLSGFESPQKAHLLKGTVYMYLDGAMANGMHIAFRKAEK